MGAKVYIKEKFWYSIGILFRDWVFHFLEVFNDNEVNVKFKFELKTEIIL